MNENSPWCVGFLLAEAEDCMKLSGSGGMGVVLAIKLAENNPVKMEEAEIKVVESVV